MHTRNKETIVSLLRATKKNYYEKLYINVIIDNKKFWKSVKPLFSEKSQINTKIILLDEEEIISDSTNCAEIVNNYFSDIAINLDVDREIHTVSTHSDDPVMTAIEKYKTHPSITKIAEEDLPHSNFDFHDITEVVMLKAIENLDVSKSFPKDNIPPKIIMKNKDIFSKVLINAIRKCIENCIFPVNLKNADISPLFKKLDRLSKTITDLSAFYLHSQNYMRRYYISKFTTTLIIFFQNIYVGLERDIAHNIACYLC